MGCEISGEDLLRQLKDAGANPREAEDYILQFTERRGERDHGARRDEREVTPEGLSLDEQEAFRQQREDALAIHDSDSARAREAALDAVAWRLLEAKIRHATTKVFHAPLTHCDRTSQDAR